jgi:hypothetical protein
MRQEVGEHLKGFAPELDGHPRPMQLSALGVQSIVAKEVTHRPVSLALFLTPCPVVSQTPIIAQKYSQNFPKVYRSFHVCLLGEIYLLFLIAMQGFDKSLRGFVSRAMFLHQTIQA